MGDSRLKEECDFLAETVPQHPPPDLERPGLGCRTLVARNQDRIYPSIGNDLKDWTEASRLKAAQLLYTVLRHVEQDMVSVLLLVAGVDPYQVMHIEKIFSCLLTAAVDENPVVR